LHGRGTLNGGISWLIDGLLRGSVKDSRAEQHVLLQEFGLPAGGCDVTPAGMVTCLHLSLACRPLTSLVLSLHELLHPLAGQQQA
jgi:hypothetical protein